MVWIKQTGRFLLLLLLQVLLINNLQFLGVCHPYIYIFSLLVMPITLPRWADMLIGGVVGLILDMFCNSLGVMLAAIYFRTGNLWVTVFLHSAMDIAAMLIGGLYGTTSVAESVSGYDASRLVSVAVYLIPTVFLLRKKKLPEVQLYWGGIVKN